MDAIKNPFSPGAGSPPPELVGREGILEQARVLLGRVKEKRPEKSILLTGLRGVGKTVLLNEIERLAIKAGYRTLSLEAHEDKSLAAMLVPPLRKLLFEMDRVAGAGDKAKRALAVLKGFMDGVKVSMGEMEVGLDIDPEKGAADSGDLESDLPSLLLPWPKLLRNGKRSWRCSLTNCNISARRNSARSSCPCTRCSSASCRWCSSARACPFCPVFR